MFGNPISRLDGNQIIINSERLILSAKTKELILYGKGKFGLSTDNEFTINAVQRLVTVTDLITHQWYHRLFILVNT